MTRRIRTLGTTATAVVMMLAATGSARAQQGQPDIRNIRPAMMLVVDTSGSMERLPGCSCTGQSCTECLPDCDAGEKNRWAVTLEALTGSWDDFQCERQERTSANGATYDLGYPIPHFQPADAMQNEDGILDSYIDRVKFGLMTFDGQPTWRGASPLVPANAWREAKSRDEEGLWSYGSARDFSYPGCATDFTMNAGVRSRAAADGALISVGDPSPSFDLAAVNQSIQDSLKTVRPYGGTPIAASLSDLEQYFETDPDVAADGDPYHACRDRFALLVTDGAPDDDFRRYGCDQPGYQCPYDLSEDIAARLRCGSGTASCDTPSGVLDKLFVVGFSVDDAVKSRLDLIALSGGSEEALVAGDLQTLRARLGEVLDQVAPEPATRTVPAFVNSSTGSIQQQYQFTTGFEVAQEEGEPWTGIIERRRFACTEDQQVEPQSLTSEDRFHEVLNARSNERNLWTAIPSDDDVSAHIFRGEASAPCGSDGCPARTFDTDDTSVTADHLGLAGSEAQRQQRRAEIMDWVHARDGTPREGKRLGDIYHSSPQVVARPRLDRPDESYNAFRRLPEVANRPTTLYVGTNDGLLHAFSVEQYEGTAEANQGVQYGPGEEVWGFVPPMLLPKLDAAVTSHQYMVDGTPTVKDVFLERREGDEVDAESFRTVLVSGLRGGGRGFFALDVTDPVDPEFMWQLTHTPASPCRSDACEEDGGYMGLTYGRPALGQVFVRFRNELAERGVALLPGGKGVSQGGECDSFRDPLTREPAHTLEGEEGASRLAHRTQVRCWQPEGRSLFVVDVATGKVIKHFDESVFPSPIVGTPALFNGAVGAIATRAFVTDADGVIWRIDMSSPEPGDWSARAFHDMFFDATGEEAHAVGQPSYEPPVLSVDDDGNVVVVQATGDTDELEGTASNRVASVTEILDTDSSGNYDPDATRAALSWTKALDEGESVTGPLELFDGTVYFASFKGQVSSDACDFGASQLHAYDFVDNDGMSPPGPVPPDGDLPDQFNTSHTNRLFMGVGITQRPQCFVEEDLPDPYIPGQVALPPASPPRFQLVVQSSGGGDTSGGSVLSTEEIDLPVEASFTRIQSWASSVD